MLLWYIFVSVRSGQAVERRRRQQQRQATVHFTQTKKEIFYFGEKRKHFFKFIAYLLHTCSSSSHVALNQVVVFCAQDYFDVAALDLRSDDLLGAKNTQDCVVPKGGAPNLENVPTLRLKH